MSTTVWLLVAVIITLGLAHEGQEEGLVHARPAAEIGSVKFAKDMEVSEMVAGRECSTGNSGKNLIVPAVITFGDSTVDVGMNNKLITVVRSNFRPYGRDFCSHKPTGRFTNGKVPVDFIAEVVGLPYYPPAYLDPEATGQNLVYGVNFASSASGYNDNTSSIWNVVSLTKQLEYFEEYKLKLTNVVGAARASYILSEALYILSTGSNDYIDNYYLNLLLRRKYDKQQYQEVLLQYARQFLQKLYAAGARRIGVASLPAFGCCPSQISLFKLVNRTCVDSLNRVANDFNLGLQEVIQELKPTLANAKLEYFDTFSLILDMSENPAKYGFKTAGRSCCGTGLAEVAILCNRFDPTTCSDPNDFIFFDSYHPTQRAYQILSKELIDVAFTKLV